MEDLPSLHSILIPFPDPETAPVSVARRYFQQHTPGSFMFRQVLKLCSKKGYFWCVDFSSTMYIPHPALINTVKRIFQIRFFNECKIGKVSIVSNLQQASFWQINFSSLDEEAMKNYADEFKVENSDDSRIVFQDSLLNSVLKRVPKEERSDEFNRQFTDHGQSGCKNCFNCKDSMFMKLDTINDNSEKAVERAVIGISSSVKNSIDNEIDTTDEITHYYTKTLLPSEIQQVMKQNKYTGKYFDLNNPIKHVYSKETQNVKQLVHDHFNCQKPGKFFRAILHYDNIETEEVKVTPKLYKFSHNKLGNKIYISISNSIFIDITRFSFNYSFIPHDIAIDNKIQYINDLLTKGDRGIDLLKLIKFKRFKIRKSA